MARRRRPGGESFASVDAELQGFLNRANTEDGNDLRYGITRDALPNIAHFAAAAERGQDDASAWTSTRYLPEGTMSEEELDKLLGNIPRTAEQKRADPENRYLKMSRVGALGRLLRCLKSGLTDAAGKARPRPLWTITIGTRRIVASRTQHLWVRSLSGHGRSGHTSSAGFVRVLVYHTLVTWFLP